ncbi:hypothetical protein KIN20_021185 [Parelaphostrongylus tenuis]|uniref:Uncharacterized protein n=1 Tax=Parelaphostrongylus tenuis TaxID=148309 RepID=A0AAD5MNU5_PARTN|nr:hypothetical protein KIN20_021185 [Parelaphostrongylus tenuis]
MIVDRFRRRLWKDRSPSKSNEKDVCEERQCDMVHLDTNLLLTRMKKNDKLIQ